jgi:hypothetical protein
VPLGVADPSGQDSLASVNPTAWFHAKLLRHSATSSEPSVKSWEVV